MRRLSKKSSRQRGRRRILVSLGETKTLKLYQEGRHFLASADFEQISMAQIAKAAGTSVGAFYVRFSDKDAFLDFVTLHAFLFAKQSFEQTSASIASHSKPAEALADALIAQFANREFAGIVRLALKRGISDLRHREPFDQYRDFVADQMLDLLPVKSDKGRKSEISLAVQAAIGILTDAAVSAAPSEPAGVSKYRDILVRILSVPPGKTTLRKAKPVKERAQSRIKTI